MWAEPPRDLDFKIVVDKLPPDSVRYDVTASTRRHLLLATDNQLQLLCGARRWYMDATFWVVRKPLTQLFLIHAFITNNGNNAHFIAVITCHKLL